MKKKILLVEDEKNLCLLYKEELKEAGYNVTAVLDAESALERIKKESFDLITQIMALRKDVPIIINTAYQSYKHDFMTWAADAYVVKSSSMSELKAKIKELIG